MTLNSFSAASLLNKFLLPCGLTAKIDVYLLSRHQTRSDFIYQLRDSIFTQSRFVSAQ